MADLTKQLQLVTWNDVFVLVDPGRALAADYFRLGEIVLENASKYPRGIGGVTIIPPHATPPSDGARAAMNTVMQRLGTSLRCFCWFVEGGGFQAAMVRGVLTGVKMFGRLPYETHVATSLPEALQWTVRRLDRSDKRIPIILDGVRAIDEQRSRADADRR